MRESWASNTVGVTDVWAQLAVCTFWLTLSHPGSLASDSFSFSFSSRWHRSARKGPYALRPSAVSARLPSKQCQYLSGWTQIDLDLGGWNVGRFLSPLLFPSGDQCCDALATAAPTSYTLLNNNKPSFVPITRILVNIRSTWLVDPFALLSLFRLLLLTMFLVFCFFYRRQTVTKDKEIFCWLLNVPATCFVSQGRICSDNDERQGDLRSTTLR